MYSVSGACLYSAHVTELTRVTQACQVLPDTLNGCLLLQLLGVLK